MEFKLLGYDAIELTGGLLYQKNIINEIVSLRRELGVEIQLHNYSPPPSEDFVLNLASLDTDTFQKSIEHVEQAIDFTRKNELGKYAVHAGFYIPMDAIELGRTIKKRDLFDKNACTGQFVSSLNQLYSSNKNLLYVENNVVSASNFKEYGENPFMLTCADDYFNLKEQIPSLRLLLDLAHLKVSCNTLGLSFEKEAKILNAETDYVHISDNDAISDSNQGLIKHSRMYELLQEIDLTSKTLTLEVYSGVEDLKRSYNLIEALR